MADSTQYRDEPPKPPDEVDSGKLPADHPALDSNIDAQELYDEGYSSAADLHTKREEYDDDNRY
ncbi:MAG: hypothetical protein AAB834_02065 [Patescibacteria group bacterium]